MKASRRTARRCRASRPAGRSCSRVSRAFWKPDSPSLSSTHEAAHGCQRLPAGHGLYHLHRLDARKGVRGADERALLETVFLWLRDRVRTKARRRVHRARPGRLGAYRRRGDRLQPAAPARRNVERELAGTGRKARPDRRDLRIAQAGDAVRLTMTESHERELSDDILSGGRTGWPAILSSLKSVLETGQPLNVKMEPPIPMLAALKKLGIKIPGECLAR